MNKQFDSRWGKAFSDGYRRITKEDALAIFESGQRSMRCCGNCSGLDHCIETKNCNVDPAGVCGMERGMKNLDTITAALRSDTPRVALNKITLPRELSRLSGTLHSARWHSEGDVWEHTLRVVELVRTETTDSEVLLAVLFHDVGKPDTLGIKEDGEYHNRGHEKVGSEIAERMGLSEKTVWLIRNHMRAHQAIHMRKKKLKEFVGKPWFPDLVLLCKSDSAASVPLDTEDMSGKLLSLKFLEERLNGRKIGI